MRHLRQRLRIDAPERVDERPRREAEIMMTGCPIAPILADTFRASQRNRMPR